MARRIRVLWIVLGSLGLLLVGGLVFASLRLDSLVNRIKDQQVAALEKTLGRSIKVGPIATRLFSLSVEVSGIEIAADPRRPAETLPVLSLGRLKVGVAARTLWSLGKRPALTELTIEGLTVNVVKHADGTLNLKNLVEALPPSEESEKPPMDEATRAQLRAFTIERVRLADGRVRFVDLARGGATVEISRMNLAIDDATMARPVAVAFSAALLGAEKNFELEARLGATPPALDPGPPLERLRVKLAKTDLAPLVPFIAAAMPDDLGGLESATVAMDVDLAPGAASPGGRGPTTARADITLDGLRFQKGEAFTVRLDSDLTAALAADGPGDLDIRRFTLGVGPMALEARGKVQALRTAPVFSDFAITSKGFDFDQIRKLLPDLDTRTGAILHGPFAVSLTASGSAGAQSFQGGVELAAASISIPAVLRKPAGVPLGLTVSGRVQGDAVDLQSLALTIADWRLEAKGTVRGLQTPAPAVDLTANAASPGLGSVLRLLPPVAEGLGPRATVNGTLAIEAQVKGTATAMHATLDARLARLAVAVPGARLGGGGTLSVVADRKGAGLDATVRGDFTALEALYLDVLRKAAGVPLTLRAGASQQPGVQTVTFDLQAAELKAGGRATLRPQGKSQAVAAEVTIAPFRVRSLTAMLPALTETPLGDVHAGAKLTIRGQLDTPGSMEVRIEDLALSAGRSDLRGVLVVTNLERPRVELEARSRYLDVDDFVPPSPGKTGDTKGKPAPASGTRDKDQEDPLKGVTGRIRLDVKKGRTADIDYQNLRADLTVDGGRAVAKVLEVGVFGGNFMGTGSELSLLDEQEPFSAKGKLENIDAGAVITHFAGIPDLVKGRLTGNVELGGKGTTTALLTRTLQGLLEGQLADAELLGGDLLGSLFAPVAAKVNALPGAGKLLDPSADAFKKAVDKGLGTVRAALAFDKGAINLNAPLVLSTRSGPLSLDGRVLLDGKWDLTGVLTLSPAAASALTGNRLQIDRPVPVKLAVGGPLAHPRVVPTALDEVVRIYALAFTRSAAGQAARAKLEGAAGSLLQKSGLADKLPAGAKVPSATEARAQAEAQLAESRARAQAETAAQAERTRLAAEEARVKAEAEARVRAEEAKRKAAEKGQEKLRGLLGR
jgi:hypothetical protein